MNVFDNVQFIKASAGSGKTYRLMELVEKVVIEDKVPVTAVMATTFTVKAANELKSRIRRKLLESDRVDEAQQVESALIGTVDSVCGRLLSDYAIDIGGNPSMAVLPEENVDEFFARSLRDTIAMHQDSVVPLGERLGFTAEGWMRVLRDLIDGARSNGLDATGFAAAKNRSVDIAKRIYDGTDTTLSLDGFKDELSPCIDEIRLIAKEHDGDSVAAKASYGSGLCEFCCAAAGYEGSAWKELLKLVKDTPKAKRTTKPDLLRAMQGLWSSLSARLLHSAALQRDVEDFISVIFDMAEAGLSKFQEYKREFGLVDFVDQEAELLKLLMAPDGDGFRNAIKERIKIVMVDEFQDTSPLQLSLFLKLNEIVGKSVWVGDPKQSIYSFRGADPAFMGEIMKCVEAAERERIAAGREKLVDTLRNSWRSRKNLIEFSNEVFSRIFPDVPIEDVKLELDPKEEVKPERQDGTIRVWERKADYRYSGDALLADLAARVRRLFFKDGKRNELKYRDVAILLRTNKQCSKMSVALQKERLPVSVGGGQLKDDPVAYLGMCAYRRAFSLKDTIAGEVLQRYVPGVDLNAIADVEQNLSPLELLERSLVGYGVDDYVRSGLDCERGLASLEALRELCGEYMTDCALRGVPAGQAGFIRYFMEADKAGASAAGGECVQVMTYHKAKGLEWPVVVLASLDDMPTGSPFGVRVIQDGEFTAERPLANRALQYIPAPFGSSHDDEPGPFINQNIEEFDNQRQVAMSIEIEETKRLMYVGVTRAKDEIVFFAKRQTTKVDPGGEPKIAWLESLSTPSLFMQGFLEPEGTVKWTIGDCPRKFDVEMELLPAGAADGGEGDESGLTDKNAMPAGEHLPYRIAPSALEGCASNGISTGAFDLPACMALKFAKCSSDLGECVHSYMAVAVPGSDDRGLAAGLIERWGVGEVLSDDELVAAGRRLRDWINQELKPKAIHTEVPMCFKHPNGQISEGFIDMLVEKSDGTFVIIDHKVINDHSAADCVKTYAAQQEIYLKAVKEVCGPVNHVYLHLPVQGKMVEITY